MSHLLPLLVLASGRLAGIEPEQAFSFTDEEAAESIVSELSGQFENGYLINYGRMD